MIVFLANGIQPKAIFDGQRLEMKFKTQAKRIASSTTRLLTNKIKLETLMVTLFK